MFVTLWAAPDLPRLLAWPQWTPQRTPRPHPRPRSSCWPGSSRARPATSGPRSSTACCASRAGIGADAEPGAGVDKLVRRTPEGIPVAAALHAADVADLPPVGVPGQAAVRAGRHDRRPGPRRLGRAAAPRRSPTRARGRPRRPGERRHLGLARRRRADRGRGAARRVLDGVLLDLAPVVLDAGAAPTPAAAARVPATWRARLADPAALLRHPRARPARAAGPHRRRARTSRSIVPLALRVAAEYPLVRAIVVDGLPVHDAGGVGRPGAGLHARGRRGLPAGAHRRRARRRRPPPGCWSSATPPPPTSSRRSPSCAPRAGCGRGCSRPAARPTRHGASASTPSPRRR